MCRLTRTVSRARPQRARPSVIALPKQHARCLDTLDTGYLVGDALTQADVAVWDTLDAIKTWIEGADFGAFGRVEKFYESIKARPAIAEYLASDRRIEKKT